MPWQSKTFVHFLNALRALRGCKQRGDEGALQGKRQYMPVLSREDLQVSFSLTDAARDLSQDVAHALSLHGYAS